MSRHGTSQNRSNAQAPQVRTAVPNDRERRNDRRQGSSGPPSVRTNRRRRSRDNQNMANAAINKMQSIAQRAIAATDAQVRPGSKTPPAVAAFMQKTLKQGVPGLKREFTELRKYVPTSESPEQMVKAFIANQPAGRNRFKDVMCLERTRVVLNDYHTDYIHANRVIGGTMNIICTQGPLVATINDFWHMVWQEEAGQIVMLCDQVEAGRDKCSQYWPLGKGASATYGAITVSTVNEAVEDLGGNQRIVTSTLEVCQSGCAPRTVFHRHWQHWPDRGNPSDPRVIIRFRQTIGKCNVGQHVVVHCSAGIGRTGTLVMIDMALSLLDTNEPVDMCEKLKELRNQRLHSVQNESQYLFVFRTLIEYITNKWKGERSRDVDKWLADYDRAQPKQQ